VVVLTDIERAMNILVLNSGSSSFKFSIFSTAHNADPKVVLDGELSGVGSGDATLMSSAMETAQVAIHLVLDAVLHDAVVPIEAVGYRVVHPGPKLHDHQRITDEVLRDLEAAIEFAPLHDPAVLQVIRAAMKRFPDVAHYACFDTVFHRTMPEEATVYPLPPAYGERGVRRYGFHGLSCESIVRQMHQQGTLPHRMVIAHLGSGCSVTALVDGLSVDTTMGLTPTGGVVMGTRSGDLDPGLVLYLLREQKGSREQAIAAVETMLNHDSGMVALSGMANDVKAVRCAGANGDENALLALKVFTRSVTKAIGGFCWSLGGLDAIVFAGGIGEHDAESRQEILHGLLLAGVEIDAAKNRTPGEGIRPISATGSRTEIFIVPAQEDLMIAVHVEQMANSR
jgi:acetate kinase